MQRLLLARTVGEVQEIVIGTARTLCGADGATLVLREGDHTHYVAEDAVGPLWLRRRFELTECVAGWAMLDRRAVVVPDITQDERETLGLYRATFVRALVVVPFGGGEPTGAIGNYWARPHAPTEHDLMLLEALAEAAGKAIANVQRWGHAEHRMAQQSASLDRALEHTEEALTTLAHELRNTLGTSRGLVALVLDQPGDTLDHEHREDLRLAYEGLTSGLRVVEEQLAHARDRANELANERELVEVGQILSDLARTYRTMNIGTHVPVVAEQLDPRVALTTDRHLLTQALRNLVSNALKFTDHGEVRLSATVDGERDTVTISVADTGIGIARSDRSRIFERYGQVDGAQQGRPQGTGLGLPYVQQVIGQLGGTLDLSSAPGAGSTFRITLPR